MISLRFIIVFLVLILFVHILATIHYWYWSYTWFDMPMHFLGGFWLAMVYFWFRQKRGLTRMDTRINTDKAQKDMDNVSENLRSNLRESTLLMIISCLGFVVLIGVFWEFFEFFYDLFISNKGYAFLLQQGSADTLSDLFFDLLGGSAMVVIFRFRKSKDYFSR